MLRRFLFSIVVAGLLSGTLSPGPARANEQTRETQINLMTLGYYYASEVDGFTGPHMRIAIEAWQRDQGHPATGDLSGEQRDILAEQATTFERVRLHPIDETDLDDGFAAFRAELEAAVAARDTEAVVALSSPDIKLSFGGDEGHEAMRAMLDSPDSYLWQSLDETLALGAVRSGPNEFCIPYIFCADPILKAYDAFTTSVVINPEARLLNAPDPDGEVIALLDYDVVTVVERGERYTEVTLVDGRQGFVANSDHRAIIDLRLLIRKGAEGWRLDVAVAGD